MKNSEKKLYNGLKGIFNFLTGVTGVSILAVVGITVVAQIPSVVDTISSNNNFDVGRGMIEALHSPFFVVALLLNLVLDGIIFYLVSKFFKNLANEQIFVEENVITAKRIAMILAIYSITSGLPGMYASMNGLVVSSADGSYMLDMTYLVGGVIVWALAKILERANTIAEENELTI